MRFRELSIPGAFVVEGDPRRDNRGSFARTFCAREFAERGLDVRVAQCNVSRTAHKGTIRGLQFRAIASLRRSLGIETHAPVSRSAAAVATATIQVLR